MSTTEPVAVLVGEELVAEVTGERPVAAPVVEESVAERLKWLRRAARFSQPELSLRSGVPEGTLWGYEYGKRVPTLKNIFEIAYALGLEPSEMLRGVRLERYRRNEPERRPRRGRRTRRKLIQVEVQADEGVLVPDGES